MLSLRAHSVLDYVTAFFLVLAPFLFGFVSVDVARNVFLVTGTLWILYSLFTNSYHALIRVIPLGVHMALDVGVALFLALAPWTFGYRGEITGSQELVHYLIGAFVLTCVFLTMEKTEAEKRAHHVDVRAPAEI